ncbi:MAG: tRNA lysidine(34) synthetase TilS, partial [Caulobacteraceae bacterium]
DDLAEAQAMRAAGASAPSPRVWSPSPAWPDGRGVFLLRPLLGVRRAELRALLTSLGERWIDDPANDDVRSARARARSALSQSAARPPAPPDAASPPPELSHFRQGAGGELVASLEAFANGPPEERRRLLAVAVLCASGTARPPRSAALERLGARIAEDADFVATLAGARVEARRGRLVFCRERGRRQYAPAPLPVGESVFDGRFLIGCGEAGCRIAPLRGLAAKLPSRQRRRLTEVEPAARPGLPAVLTPNGEVSSPVLGSDGAASARPLALERLRAALGAIPDEASLRRVEWARCGPRREHPSGGASGESAGA